MVSQQYGFEPFRCIMQPETKLTQIIFYIHSRLQCRSQPPQTFEMHVLTIVNVFSYVCQYSEPASLQAVYIISL